jgi:hypothetical protein
MLQISWSIFFLQHEDTQLGNDYKNNPKFKICDIINTLVPISSDKEKTTCIWWKNIFLPYIIYLYYKIGNISYYLVHISWKIATIIHFLYLRAKNSVFLEWYNDITMRATEFLVLFHEKAKIFWSRRLREFVCMYGIWFCNIGKIL